MVVEGIPTDPVVVGAAAVAVVAVLTGGAIGVRALRSSPGERFASILASRERVAVVLHPNPDPDAMACGMAVAAIADETDTAVTVHHAGEVRHPENRAFKHLLDVDLEPIEGPGDIAADDVVLLDHNTPRGFPGAQSLEAIAVIDHHPGEGTGSEFTDVRPAYGAAATIFVEYLEALGTEEYLTERLATGLAYGILSDTQDLTRGATDAEFAAMAAIHEQVDDELLDRIAHPEVSDDILQTKATAIREKRLEGSFALCDLAAVPTVDAIPQAADELIQLEGVTAVVVYGKKDGTLHLSGRSRDDRVHMGEALETAVEDIPMAEAGGHQRMGGGQLSVDHMNGIGPSEGISTDEFEEELLAALEAS